MEVRQPDRGPDEDVSSVAVLGPGAVGGVVAVGLIRAGVSVVCVARPDTAAVISANGLSLKRGANVETVRPKAVTELDEPVDLLLVTVKATTLDDALERVYARAATIIPLLNGIEHMETLRARFPDSRVVAGSIGWIEAWLERPGVVVQNTPRVVMSVASDVDAQAEALLHRSGVELRVHGTEKDILWDKLARQAPVAAATTATQRSIGELRADPQWRPRLEQAIRETCAVAAADGVALSADSEWGIIESMPPALTSSTARDVAAGRPSELDAISGAAVRAAHRLGVCAQSLEEILAEAEACQARSR
jgi:2-dehydropantoate 2-reductase